MILTCLRFKSIVLLACQKTNGNFVHAKWDARVGELGSLIKYYYYYNYYYYYYYYYYYHYYYYYYYYIMEKA